MAVIPAHTYPWPKDGDHDDKVSYDGKKPCRDETAGRRHAEVALTNLYTVRTKIHDKQEILLFCY